MSFKLFSAFMMIGLLILAGVATAQDDPLGKIDTVTLITEQTGAGNWLVTAQIWNDEELAAFDIPIKYTAGMAKLVVDSISMTGTRVDYFAQKYYQVDTTKQIMHIGGIAYMGADKPPLAPGSGDVGRIYISVMDDKNPGMFACDTSTFPPNNSLMLVDKNAKIIVPALKIKSKVEEPEKKE